ncbi:Transporter substrate-binding domain-containing protein OS=Castellaniella sp OX=1955812 GN=EPN31_05240 PE=4 SV=1 [Castellaniella denitrificans]|uniref:transporter substrate-binding domain-containing protein n=1 Tax=Castellaniella sp. TaxID=1955812 RepID=UPI002B002E5F|nr:transporter substrate-binding domain-containing protein [Castellaniella sp.]
MSKRSTLKWLLAGGVAAAAAFAGTARADLLADVKAAGVLTLATDMQYMPFDFYKDNRHQGFDKDYFEEIGKALGVRVRFLDLPWTGTLPGLEARRFDLVAAPVIVTRERKQRYRFTLPIADATVAFLKRANDGRIARPEDVAGKAIGSQRGTSQLAQMKAYADTLSPKPAIHEYVDLNQAYADLANGRLAAVAGGLPNIAAVAKERKNVFEVVMPPFGQQTYYAFLGRKDEDSASLIQAIDDATRAMREDGRFATLQKRWFGMEMAVPAEDFEPAL